MRFILTQADLTTAAILLLVLATVTLLAWLAWTAMQLAMMQLIMLQIPDLTTAVLTAM